MKEMDLIRLIEECGEVIQAATKILRFGVNGSYCDGTPNVKALVNEVGDFVACLQRLDLPGVDVAEAIKRKRVKIRFVEKFELGFDCELTREQREELHGKYTTDSKGQIT